MPEETIQLSDREQEILEQIANGATNQQIANSLGISINTVKVHVRNIFSKIGVSSRTEASMYAVRHGLVYVAATSSNSAAEWDNSKAPVPDHVGSDNDTAIESATSPVPTQQESTVAPPLAPTPAQPSADPQVGIPDTGVPAQTAPEGSKPTYFVRRHMLLLGAFVASVIIIIGMLVFMLVSGIGQEPEAPIQEPTSIPSDIPSNNSGSQVFTANQIRLIWSSLNALPMVQSAAAATSLDGSIFVVGGETPEGTTGALWRYDPANDTWRSLASKPTPVSDVQAVVLNGRIYVPGGKTADGTISDELEMYDPVQGNWNTAAAMPAPRSAYALVTLEGTMYLFGGWDGTSMRDEVYAYDPDTDTWEEETVMPTPRAYGGAVAIDNKIYVMGGENDSGMLATSEIYIPARSEGQWTASAAMLPEPRSRFGIGAIANFIILLGGTPDTRPYYYNIRTDTWQSFEEPELELLQSGLGIQPAVAQRDTSLFIVNNSDANLSTSNLFELRLLYTIILPLNP